MSMKDWLEKTCDLKVLVEAASREFPSLQGVYIFGSRRFKSGSLRSDIDLMFRVDGPLRPGDVRKFVTSHCDALDVFIVRGGLAESAVNESHIQYADVEGLLAATSALPLWSRISGATPDLDVYAIQQYADHANFVMTALPNITVPLTLPQLQARLSALGLPTSPIFGETLEEVVEHVVTVARRVAAFDPKGWASRGTARRSWAAKPETEYDYQDLFWIAIKPWFADAQREVVEVVFDGQSKHSDFSFMKSRIIIEMKLIKDGGDRRETSKTLDGLKNFYLQNPNVRFLLFIIYVTPSASVDAGLWEQTYSWTDNGQVVRTIIIHAPELS